MSCDLDEMEQSLQADRCQTCAYPRAPRSQQLCSLPELKQRAVSEYAAAVINAIAVTDWAPCPRGIAMANNRLAHHMRTADAGMRVDFECPGGQSPPGHFLACSCAEPVGS
jgi:hypothetical protein